MFFTDGNPRPDEFGEGPRGYSLDWPRAQRWNPQYMVPRNSWESANTASSQVDAARNGPNHEGRSMSYGRSRRDMDTHAPTKRGTSAYNHLDEEEFSNLTHWFETSAELYMNELDNRARWDPRWLNITRRERYEGLTSAAITIVDYPKDAMDGAESIRISSKKGLAATLQSRPAESELRVITVCDLSRFVMGALGQMYSIDAEFWFEHLVNSGYCASDSGLKLKNAVWMNWAERETHFRHRALPGIGQRTEWNSPRRIKDRSWAHLRWGRLGLLHYLGRKGFYEDEINERLGDGRCIMERDVALDKYGLLLTAKKKALAQKKVRARKHKQKAASSMPHLEVEEDDVHLEETSKRVKASNVYRAYSTFDSLPQSPHYWKNRDLRVMAPEGISYWSGADSQGRKTVILIFDPVRSMRHSETNKVTPSLTFMPRAMEFESCDAEELWRIPDADETYLDPPPPALSKNELKKQKMEAKQLKLKEKKQKLKERMASNGKVDAIADYSSESSYTSDSDYDEEYQETLRAEYTNPGPIRRDRDYARKYALSSADLVHRYMRNHATSELVNDESLIPSILARLSLDDLWQLLAELRIDLDRVDADLGSDLQAVLLESAGIRTRQNVGWIRSTLQELLEWTNHLAHVSPVFHSSKDLSAEVDVIIKDIQALQTRAESTLNLLVAMTGLAQSTLVINQTSGINKLTELAFFFVPLSFITSVFSMQVLELTSSPPAIWTWAVALILVFFVTYLIRCTVRSPSMQRFAMHCRATMLTRFSSSRSRQLNTVGNRAIAKFLLLGLYILLIAFLMIFFYSLICFLVFVGIWLGPAATALYFIVVRWPEPAVLVPCFISLPLAGLGLWVCWLWSDEITTFVEDVTVAAGEKATSIFPEKWTLDNVDDDDLAKEGVNTYARQAIVLATA